MQFLLRYTYYLFHNKFKNTDTLNITNIED